MQHHRGLTPTDLGNMTSTAGSILTGVQQGADPTPDDVATLVAYVRQLSDEVDVLHWRRTVATMALDGRVHPDELQMHGGQAE